MSNVTNDPMFIELRCVDGEGVPPLPPHPHIPYIQNSRSLNLIEEGVLTELFAGRTLLNFYQ